MIYYFLRFLGFLPLGVRAALGCALGRLFCAFPTKERTVASLQMRLKLGTDRELVGVFQNVCRTLLETLNISPLVAQATKCGCRVPEDVIALFKSKKQPIVVLTAHTGNWELLAALFTSQGVEVSAMARKARRATLQHALLRLREEYGVNTIWRSDRSGTRELIARMRRGSVVAALIDQDTAVTSELSDFFGTPAKTPCSLISLGIREKALFYTAFIVRRGDDFEVSIAPIDYKQGENADATHGHSREQALQRILRIYHDRLEALIRDNPSQWVWFHKRWRSSSGTTLSSRAYIEELERLVNQSVAAVEV